MESDETRRVSDRILEDELGNRVMRENLDAVQVRFDLGGNTLLCWPSIPLDERRVESGVKPSDQAVLNEGRERVKGFGSVAPEA